jgi:hypothetical protein
MKERSPALLLGLTGMNIEGGIAVVSRCIARALEESIDRGELDRADRVLFLDDPKDAPSLARRGGQRLSRGSKPRFLWQLWWGVGGLGGIFSAAASVHSFH